MTAQRSIDLGNLSDRVRLFGEYDRNLSAIESSLDVAVHADGDRLVLAGDAAAVARAEEVVRRVLDAAVGGAHITPDDVALALSDARVAGDTALPSTLLRTHRGREIRPRTAGQRRFVRSIEESTLTFGIGPAGTGKTYLAVVMAVRALKRRDVARVILSRPAVEAGERLGFLPGDLREKVRSVYAAALRRAQTICSTTPSSLNIWNAERSKSRRSRTCAGERSRTRSSFSTKRRTRPTIS